MLIKKTQQSKQSKFNFELRKSFSAHTLFIKNSDISKALFSINMLSEYIRSAYFENYRCFNNDYLEKYCRLLLKFEQCNQTLLVKECKNLSIKILNNALTHDYSIKTIRLSLSMSESMIDQVSDLSNQLMTFALGSKIKAVTLY